MPNIDLFLGNLCPIITCEIPSCGPFISEPPTKILHHSLPKNRLSTDSNSCSLHSLQECTFCDALVLVIYLVECFPHLALHIHNENLQIPSYGWASLSLGFLLFPSSSQWFSLSEVSMPHPGFPDWALWWYQSPCSHDYSGKPQGEEVFDTLALHHWVLQSGPRLLADTLLLFQRIFYFILCSLYFPQNCIRYLTCI